MNGYEFDGLEHVSGGREWHGDSSPSFRPSLGGEHHKRTDSSILSPLAHKTNPQHATRPTGNHELFHNLPWNQPGSDDLSILDLDLGSSSGSDISDGEEDSVAHTPPRPHPDLVADPLNPAELSEDQDRIVCAISESRSSDVIGLATLNVTMGRVDIVRIVNDDRYRRLVETLWRMPTCPQTFLVLKKVVDERSKSSLALCLKQEFPDSEIVPLEREHWNESEGLRMIGRFALRRDIKAVRSDLDRNFYASCAFSAVGSIFQSQL